MKNTSTVCLLYCIIFLLSTLSNIPLLKIKEIISSEDFDPTTALQDHLAALLAKRKQLDLLITNLEKTIQATKGEIMMNDAEKFAGFKRKLIEENEKKYGAEIRAQYGDDPINRSNAKIADMTRETYAEIEVLTQEINDILKKAFAQGDPASELAQETCRLHKRWLCFFWDHYSKEAHLGVTQMYVDDPRFTAYYDKIAPGCAAFLRDAVLIYCRQAASD